MTRDELKALGLTDEQIEKVIAEHAKGISSATAKAKADAEKYKADAQKAADLQSKLDEIEQKNLSDLDKEKKARESAEKLASDLQKQLTRSAVEGVFAKAGLSGDDFSGMIDALATMDMDTAKNNAESFVSGISKRDAANKTQWEKDNFNKTPNPGAGKSGKEDDPYKGHESAAAKYAQKYSQQHNPQPVQNPTPAPIPTTTY